VRYVWDPAKDLLNRRKHGLSLADGVPALEDPHRQVWFDDRYDYGELRIVTAGKSGAQTLIVVSTERGFDAGGKEEVRIISVRKANPYEDDWFDFG
jgi:hypothetical protein